ncbi:MAG: YggS family pyridoxal phosphate-dependent enzyme [Cocleimonas sp.]
MTQIRDKLQIIGTKVSETTEQYHRPSNSVQLLAVSKRHSVEAIRDAYQAGQTAFGENYVQELVEKAEALIALDSLSKIEWHFIGPLQSNKTKQIAAVASWVHTIDRFKIAQRLNNQRPDNLPPLSVCIQVNISEEISKSGVSVNEVAKLAQQISELSRLQLRGLMVIPAPETDFKKQRRAFAKVAALKETLNQSGYPLDTLSMGMSSDMEAAIAEGATIVRIGTAIFGARE